jgi:alkaline phosphatase D
MMLKNHFSESARAALSCGILLCCTIVQVPVARSQDAPAKLESPLAGMGLMVGEVTSMRALAQVRLTCSSGLVDRDVPGCPGVVEFVLESDRQERLRQQVRVTAEHDHIARAAFIGLQAGTQYAVRTRIGVNSEQLRPGPSATFRTLPGAESAVRARFVVVTGMNYAKFHGDARIDRVQHLIENNTDLPAPYAGPDKHLGYPALESIRQLGPEFFVGTGDNVYYDTPDAFRARTKSQMRQKWHEQFVQPRYRQLFAEVPTYSMIDDHDYRVDDCDNSGTYEPSPQLGRETMLEQLPIAAADETDALTYRTHRVTRDLQIWLPENRMYRSSNAMRDGPDKTIWGEKQKAWLKSTLAASDATFKLLISPTPMVGPDDLRKTDNHTNIGGFRHERDAFFAWLVETGIAKKNFYLVCGDRHWQYHSIHPTGLEEFSCGALIDANARLGRKPGDPKSTDPDGSIQQPYCQEQASGGFLLIDAAPALDMNQATLTFRFFDERGRLLHEHRKVAGRS